MLDLISKLKTTVLADQTRVYKASKVQRRKKLWWRRRASEAAIVILIDFPHSIYLSLSLYPDMKYTVIISCIWSIYGLYVSYILIL